MMAFATHYSRLLANRLKVRAWPLSLRLAVLMVGLASNASGQSSATANGVLLKAAARSSELYQQAKREYFAKTNDAENAWHFARACFDWAEFSTNDTQRANLAQQGIKASRVSIVLNSNSAPAYFYFGMNLGQLARTKSLGALPLVDEMEQAFLSARSLDENYLYAAPDRFLGQLYLQAPSFGSVGSRSKARTHLKRALELAPEYPENRINWIEANLRWRQTEAARTELDTLEAGLGEARARFNGLEWAALWVDWDERLEVARATLHKLQAKNRPTASPKGTP